MSLRPRLELEDSFAREKACTICGETALSVVHLKGFPDYVTCARCGAAFVMEEGGQRALYGSIPAEYPETRDFALKQWTSLEAIAALAEAERPPGRSADRDGAALASAPGSAGRNAPAARPPGPAGHGALASAPPASIDQPEQQEAEPEAIELSAPTAEAPVGELDLPLEPFDWPSPTGGAPAPEAEAPLDPLDWPAPAASAAEPEPPLEPFDWPSPAGGAPAPEAEAPLEPLDWPAPASEATPAFEPDMPAPPQAVFEPETPIATRPQFGITQPPPAVEPSEPEPEPSPEAWEPAAAAEPEAEPSPEAWEPAPGRRFRVRYLASQPRIPSGVCLHCLRTASRRTLVVVGAAMGPVGQPRRTTFTLPLCSSCYRRARARSEEEKSSRLMAHLISVLIAAVAVVGALALSVVPIETPLIAAGLLGVLGVTGYGIPALLLLGRGGRFAPPPDALFVRSTLLVSAQPGAGETLFDWRNPGSAGRFQEANPGETGETIFEVPDPLSSSEPRPHEPDP
jgi:hypothetical protein